MKYIKKTLSTQSEIASLQSSTRRASCRTLNTRAVARNLHKIDLNSIKTVEIIALSNAH